MNSQLKCAVLACLSPINYIEYKYNKIKRNSNCMAVILLHFKLNSLTKITNITIHFSVI